MEKNNTYFKTQEVKLFLVGNSKPYAAGCFHEDNPSETVTPAVVEKWFRRYFAPEIAVHLYHMLTEEFLIPQKHA